MKLQYILKTSAGQLLRNKRSSLVVLFSLTVCMTAIFMLTEILLGYADFWKNVSLYKRSYELNMSDNAPDEGREFVNELLFGDRFGQIETVDLVQAAPKNHMTADYIVSLVYLEGNGRYAPRIDLLEGRTFTEEERATGENVIVLSELTDGRVGASVKIGTRDYRIIGKCSGVLSVLTLENVMQTDSFSLSAQTVTFARKLTGEREEAFLQEAGKAGASPETLFEKNLGGAVLDNAVYTGLILLVLLCAAGICSQLFRYMAECRRYEYSVYGILGICRTVLAGFFYTPIFVLSAISFGLGFALYRATEPLQKEIALTGTLKAGAVLTVAAVMLGMLLTVTAPVFGMLKRISPTERM